MLLPGDQRADIQGLVPDQREGPRGVDSGRCQNRIDRLHEIGFQIFPLRNTQNIRIRDKVVSHLAQSRNEGARQRRILPVNQLMTPGFYLIKLLPGSQSGKVRLCHIRVYHIHQGCDTHHKKLIQV